MPNPDALDQSTPSTSVRRARARKHRWPRILFLSTISLLILVPLVAGISVLWLRLAAQAALPVLDGDLKTGGLSGPVTVRRDAHGVPHIEATTQEDLFVAQGYVTAQDRLWQMDVLRRSSYGELSEIFGPSQLKHDEVQRVLQMRSTAQRIYANLPSADRGRLDAYARGVNLYIDQHQDSLPPEFKLLFYHPRPWTGEDAISVGLSMVQSLDTHFQTKLSRERIASKLNNPQLEAELYPVGSWRDHPPTGEVVDLTQPRPAPPPSDDEEDERTESSLAPHQGPLTLVASQTTKAAKQVSDNHDLRQLCTALGQPECEGCAPGSNNWVIAGRHTVSGKPLLSNDMHLALLEPNIWFMADLTAPGYHAAGVTLPGTPGIIAGHNDHVAWGFTALYADVQDVYVEHLDGNGSYQAADGSWKPLILDHETIHVRGGKDVALDLKSTDHGPLLNPILGNESRALSLRWTLFDSALNALPIYQLDTASNWTEFSAALRTWCWPTQNVVYSDDQGHIAYHAVGRVPLRPAGLQTKPIQDAQHEWQGYIPFDDMPNSLDPPSGFLATANSRVTTERSPYPLSLEWVDPYRSERIYKSLQGRDGLGPKDMLAVQTDIYSEVDQEMAHRFAYAIDHAAGNDDRLRKAADLMRSWDGKLTIDSAAASLVTQTQAALWPLILEPKLGRDDAEDYRWSESRFAEEEIVMHGSSDWLPPGFKDWDSVLSAAVRKGMEKSKDHPAAPPDISLWTYGSWHVVDIEHPLATLLPPLRRIAGTGSQPLSGDTTTVKQVGRAFGPSQRFTMDWSNVDGSTESIVLGESGNPYSPYFRDQWKDYYAGTTFPLPYTPAAVAAQTQHTLRLLP
jgi:penicillin amidase